MGDASNRLNDAPQDTEDLLQAVEVDDLARKVEFLSSGAKAAAPAGQNAAPAARKAVAADDLARKVEFLSSGAKAAAPAGQNAAPAAQKAVAAEDLARKVE